MVKRPGGALATRPLHFFWICDCSGSMSLDGKMDALNQGIRDSLPAMRQIAEENANAQVLIHTLRFSSGATWLVDQPVALEDFQWGDLVADVPDGMNAFSAEFKSRLQREGAKTGDVQIALKWENYNDLDLHVICPSGEHIYFGHRNSECGGELDVDMNVSPTSMQPVENIYWGEGQAPMGTYQVLVNHYKNHGQSGCQDPTSYQVAVKIGDVVQEFPGQISHGETQTVYTFDLESVLATSGGNTDLGTALTMVADQLKMPPMTDRALPPVLVLLSDGQPTDDFGQGLENLMAQPWAKKAVRLAIAIGSDVDLNVLQQFINHAEIQPLQANNPTALTRFIKWASTVALQTASAPIAGTSSMNLPPIPDFTQSPDWSASQVW